MIETNDYYQEELQQLHLYFAETLQEHHAARSDSSSRDVTEEWRYIQNNFEHLLEGTASSMARLRKQLDCELPKLYQSLLALHAPETLRSLPVMTVAHITQAHESMKYIYLPEATVLSATDDSNDQLLCDFVTGSGVEFMPLQVRDCNLTRYQETATQLVINVEVLSKDCSFELSRSALTLYLDEEEDTAAGILMALSEHVDNVLIRFDQQQLTHTLDNNSIGLAAFKNNLLSVVGNEGTMNETLKNYFVYPRLYHFITINDSPDLDWPEDCTSFDIIINLNKPISFFKKTQDVTMHLNCVPCLNVQSIDCEPFTIDQTINTYPLHIGSQDKDSCHLYGINKVVALQHGQWSERQINSVTEQSWSAHDACYQWLAEDSQQQQLLFRNASEIHGRVISSSVFVDNGEQAHQYCQTQRDFSVDSAIADNMAAKLLDGVSNYVAAPTTHQYETLFQNMLAIRFASSITLKGLMAFILHACPGDNTLALTWVNSITAVQASDEICFKGYAQQQGISLCIYTETKCEEATSYLFFKALQLALCRKLPINYFLTMKVILLSFSTELYLPKVVGEENII